MVDKNDVLTIALAIAEANGHTAPKDWAMDVMNKAFPQAEPIAPANDEPSVT